MPDPLQRLVLSRTLWLIVAPPLAGFVWHLLEPLRPAGKTPPVPRSQMTWRVGVGSVLVASTATLSHVVRLARAPEGARALLQHAGSSVRVGSLVTGFDLLFDRLSGSACAFACAVAIAGAVLLLARPAEPSSWKAWAWLELALGSSLLSLLAGGFVTMLLGWGLASAAGAWLAGWSDVAAGAVRATRGFLAITALLLGSVLLGRESEVARYADIVPVEPGLAAAELGEVTRMSAGAGSVGTPPRGPARTFPELAASFAGLSTTEATDAGGLAFALVAFLVAAVATSASTPPVGAPLGLAAVASGATTSALGPFLLLRLDFLVPLVSRGGAMVAGAGVVMLAMASQRARLAPKGPSRWIALVCGAPAGLTFISLGTDGPRGAVLVFVSASLVAVLLAIAALQRGLSSNAGALRNADVDDALLRAGPERVGALLMTFEHWVVDAIAGAAGILLHASAWALDRFDVLVLAAPTDALATRAVRLGRRFEPIVGGSLVRAVLAVVVLGAFAAIALALWPVR